MSSSITPLDVARCRLRLISRMAHRSIDSLVGYEMAAHHSDRSASTSCRSGGCVCQRDRTGVTGDLDWLTANYIDSCQISRGTIGGVECDSVRVVTRGMSLQRYVQRSSFQTASRLHDRVGDVPRAGV